MIFPRPISNSIFEFAFCIIKLISKHHIIDPTLHMMTSSSGNFFCVTGHLCGESTGPLWNPLTKASDVELWFFSLICARINGWVNNRETGDLRRHRAHYDVTVMRSPPRNEAYCLHSAAMIIKKVGNIKHDKCMTAPVNFVCFYYKIIMLLRPTWSL